MKWRRLARSTEILEKYSRTPWENRHPTGTRTANVEAEAKDAGGVGEIHITDKQLNGFKIEYTGAAKEVTVKCTVQGGYA